MTEDRAALEPCPLLGREPDGKWLSFQDWVNHATRDIGGMKLNYPWRYT